MNSPLPTELSSEQSHSPLSLSEPVLQTAGAGNTLKLVPEKDKARQFSRVLCKVWVKAARTLLECAFKQKRISVYYKTSMKM